MINQFLQTNQNKIITLAYNFDTFEGVLTYRDGLWSVAGQAFHASQVSSCGLLDKPYVVVG